MERMEFAKPMPQPAAGPFGSLNLAVISAVASISASEIRATLAKGAAYLCSAGLAVESRAHSSTGRFKASENRIR